MRLLSSAEARELDSRTSAIGVAGAALMEVAGAKAALVARRILERNGRHPRADAEAAVLAGRGNNGGDGFVVARYLRNAGHEVRVYLCGGEALRAEAARNLEAWRAGGGRWLAPSGAGKSFWRDLQEELRGRADLVVDGLLGIGQTEAPRGDIGRAAELLASLGPQRPRSGRRGRGLGPKVLSLDVPTGICADTGRVYEPAVWADATVTFGHPKAGLFLYPALQLAGEVFVADIGLLPDPGFSGPDAPPGPAAWLFTAEAAAPLLGPRLPACHKGDAGVVVAFAGSVGMTGAAALVARGAIRAGAGLVTVGTPGPAQPVLAALLTEAMTLPLPAEGAALSGDAIDLALELAAGAGVVALGPGLRRTAGAVEFAKAIVRTCPRPLVLDADGLNAFAGRPEGIRDRTGGAPVILTPHPGELSRLMGVETTVVQSDRLGWARRAAEAAGAVCVLKGAATVVAAPNGYCSVIPAGNPGMASGGMGDVLTGVIAAVWAQNLRRAEAAAGSQACDPPDAALSDAHSLSWRAAAAGALLHAVAGDVAAIDAGSVGISAGDVAERLPRARAYVLRPERAPRRLRRSLLGVAGIV